MKRSLRIGYFLRRTFEQKTLFQLSFRQLRRAFHILDRFRKLCDAHCYIISSDFSAVMSSQSNIESVQPPAFVSKRKSQSFKKSAELRFQSRNLSSAQVPLRIGSRLFGPN